MLALFPLILIVLGVAMFGLLSKKAPPLAIGIGMESLQDGTDFTQVAQRFDDANVTGYSLAVGRIEWVAFPWKDHEDKWSGIAERAAEEHTDPVQSAMDVLGRERETTLTVDILTPSTNEENPEYMGRFANGEEATDFPNAVALAEGSVGEDVEKLCSEVSQRYSPDRIALTELMGDAFFSEGDEKLYSAMTGAPGFPRQPDGSINTADPQLTAWQSDIITGLLDRCHQAAGVPVEMDARVNWDNPGANRDDSGHDYEKFLNAQHHLTLWAYTDIDGQRPETTAKVVKGLKKRLGTQALDNITMSVGLWARGDAPLSPADLTTSAEHSDGASRVLVTPLSKMTDDHWKALEEMNRS